MLVQVLGPWLLTGEGWPAFGLIWSQLLQALSSVSFKSIFSEIKCVFDLNFVHLQPQEWRLPHGSGGGARGLPCQSHWVGSSFREQKEEAWSAGVVSLCVHWRKAV